MRGKQSQGRDVLNRERRILDAKLGADKVFPRWSALDAPWKWGDDQKTIRHRYGREIFSYTDEGADEAELIVLTPLMLEHALELALYVAEIRIGPEMDAAIKKAQATLACLENKAYYPPPWKWEQTPDGEYNLIDAHNSAKLGSANYAKPAERELIAQAERLHRHLKAVCQALNEIAILGGRENKRAALSIRLGTPQYWQSAAEFYKMYHSIFGTLPESYRILQRGVVPTSFKK